MIWWQLKPAIGRWTKAQMQTSSYTYLRAYLYISKSVFCMYIYICIYISLYIYIHIFISIPNADMSSLCVSVFTQIRVSTRPDDLCGSGISVASSSHDMGTTKTEKVKERINKTTKHQFQGSGICRWPLTSKPTKHIVWPLPTAPTWIVVLHKSYYSWISSEFKYCLHILKNTKHVSSCINIKYGSRIRSRKLYSKFKLWFDIWQLHTITVLGHVWR